MKTLYLITLLFLSITIHAQKEMNAVVITEKIKIDGKLIETVWKENLKLKEFIQYSPNNGKPHTNKTKIAIGYDEAYLYVGATLFSKSINKNLTSRDDTGNSDFFGFTVDFFGANREAWSFLVTPANVQSDIKVTNDGNYAEWNTVWESAVTVEEDKWTVELKIPFNSVRFSKDDFSNIQCNFERFDANTNEDSFWSFIDANVDGFLNQFGKLKGIEEVNPPINLSFSPFVAVVSEKNVGIDNKVVFNGGLDVKYVYKNAYTLDVSLVPDFSQAISDDQVFNLSPFEVKFDENRQFFVEGTEIFDKGGYLYTRRIGGEPIGANSIALNENETLISNPISSNILNLVKFTGKSKNGLSIGFLNGITAKSEAEIKNNVTNKVNKVETNPISNYNAIVIDKALKNNSSLTLVNNSVLRSGAAYDTNLTALMYRWYNQKRSYSMYFKKAVSQRYVSDEKNIFGHQYYAFLGKVSGKFLGGITFNSLDDTFDNNDFGFLTRNNQLQLNITTSYTESSPKNLFSNYTIYGNYISSYYQSLLEKETRYYQLGTYGTLKKNNHTFFVDLAYHEKEKDFYEARIKDRSFNKPAKANFFAEYQTNRNKKVFFAGYVDVVSYLNTTKQTYYVDLGYGVRSRIGQHLYLNFNQSYQKTPNNIGYLTSGEENIYFGNRDYKVLSNELIINYAINSTLNIATNFRHYWAQVDYLKHYELAINGDLLDSNTTIDFDAFDSNFNSFSIDFIAKWQFSPASEMSLGYKLGTIYNATNVASSYTNNVKSILNEEGNHTISLKMTYFIDYNSLKTKKLF